MNYEKTRYLIKDHDEILKMYYHFFIGGDYNTVHIVARTLRCL